VTPRLYLDEDVVPELARMLRSHGHDAISVHDVGGLQLEDAEQLERAANDGRTLLTYNYHDFLRISEEWFLAGRSHAGIVISYRQYARSELGALFRAVVALLESLTAEDLRDSVAVLDQFRREDP
jgi:predicted nuclease of predicted toxin-antitoxin system